MCYSKAVQLLTALVIILSCGFFYLFYSLKYSKERKKWLKPFLNNILLAFLCIGGHQFFEFLTLATDNHIVYKTGLFISILSLYFGVRALEILVNRSLHSKIVLWAVIAVGAVQMFMPASYEAVSFYIRHYSPALWTGVWSVFFIYIHICAFEARARMKDEASKRTVLLFLLAVMDISIILAVLYYIFGYWQLSVNICNDLASIWCTFAVVQAFFIPLFLSALPFIFMRPRKTAQSLKKTLLYLLVSLIVVVLLLLKNRFVRCVIEKTALS